MDAAWAAQPDSFVTFVGEIGWKLAQVEGWVPHALEELVIRVCQHFPSLVVEAQACTTQYHLLASVHVFTAGVPYQVKDESDIQGSCWFLTPKPKAEEQGILESSWLVMNREGVRNELLRQ
jgi:hypothetical protein